MVILIRCAQHHAPIFGRLIIAPTFGRLITAPTGAKIPLRLEADPVFPGAQLDGGAVFQLLQGTGNHPGTVDEGAVGGVVIRHEELALAPLEGAVPIAMYFRGKGAS